MQRAATGLYVVYVGNHGGVERGLDQVVEAIDGSLAQWPRGVKLLLENTAGSGTALGSSFEELARVIGSFPPRTIGICLDTAHGWAAGYDFSTADGVKELLDRFERLIGLDNLCVIHLNDAKVARARG